MSRSTTTPPSPDPRVPSSSGRSTPLSARGEPMVWLTGMALVIGATMIIGLLAMTVYQGLRSFWPRPIEVVTLVNDAGQTESIMGLPVRTETYDAPERERAEIERLRAEGKVDEDVMASDGRPRRRLYRIGNRDVGADAPFRWVPLYRIVSTEREADPAFVERLTWGPFVGYVEGVLIQREVELSPDAEGHVPPETTEVVDGAERRVEQEVIGSGEGGRVLVRQRVHLAEGREDAWREYRARHADAVALREKISGLEKGPLGRYNRQIERQRLRVAKAKIELRRTETSEHRAPGVLVWLMVLGGAGVSFGGSVVVRRRALAQGGGGVRGPGARASMSSWVLTSLGVGLLLFGAIEHPWSAPHMTPEHVAEIEAGADARCAEIDLKIGELHERLESLKKENERLRVVIREHGTGTIAPIRQTQQGDPMKLSDVVRAFRPNELTWGGRFGVYMARWWGFVSDDPRAANTEGGIFPVIFGTVLLTLLLSIAVVPLGVVAALYMREYAKQGLLISIVRIAVNNLAGVPSIVYGVFGLGFFCYTVGQYVDRGASHPVDHAQWWIFVALVFGIMLFAVACGLFMRPAPGSAARRSQKLGLALGGWLWAFAVVGALVVIARTPYFHGFFEAKPDGTFASKGLLWSALTLALLTLPVVIVATEEAIAAVPRTMREGSYGCGASHWQTIRRIVLPRAMPGIMTGAILAMARGAGEVAPLMLVGVVKQAAKLPFSSEFPFIHLERSFMHLGFHIYDVGFQSPDSEAAKPLVWTTTLLLIMIVLTLNIAAIRIRAGLRKKFVGGAF